MTADVFGRSGSARIPVARSEGPWIMAIAAPARLRVPGTFRSASMRLLPTILLATLLASCAKPAWVRAPDFSGMFNSENEVLVQEVARANVCGTAGGESVVTLLPSLGSLQNWTTARGVEMVPTTNKPLGEAPYAVIEFGQRPNSGYGLAISRQAALKGSELLLKATYFEPTQGRWSSAEPSSPCVVVLLPAGEYSGVRLIDQSGEVRAGTEGSQ